MGSCGFFFFFFLRQHAKQMMNANRTTTAAATPIIRGKFRFSEELEELCFEDGDLECRGGGGPRASDEDEE